MRPFKHNKSTGAGCSCSSGYLLLFIAFLVASAYGFVIASMMPDRGAGPAAVVSVAASASSVVADTALSAAESMSEKQRQRESVKPSPALHSSNSRDSSSDPVSDPDPDALLDAITSVVECRTTHGPVTIDVRAHWAPLGAAQFLLLVDQGFFTRLPFFRVAPRYITQFGVKLQDASSAGVKTVKTIKDDPSLWGRRDVDFGYLFFAGNGRHSRRDQMVLALCPQKGCIQTALGKAPWEVPIGESSLRLYVYCCGGVQSSVRVVSQNI